MSRRKQAKPRSLKQDQDDSEVSESPSTRTSSPSCSIRSELITSDSEEVETSASETTSEPAESDIGFSFAVTESVPYPCQFCDKSFSRYSYLKKHEQSHSGLLLFRCDFCSRLFKHKRSRDRHIKLHTGDKKYKCTNCDAAFSRSDHLKIHMKTHDNQKPYQCVYCNRGYNTAAALTSHLQNHKKEITSLSTNSKITPSSIFRCLRCNIIFTQSEELYVHMANKHSESSEYFKKLLNSGSNSSSEYTCVCCSKETFLSVEELQLHIQEKHGGNIRESSKDLKTGDYTPESVKVSCELCCMTFPSIKLLKIHAKCLHGANYGSSAKTLSDQTKPTDLRVVKKSDDIVPSNKKLRVTETTPSGEVNTKEDMQYDPGTLLCNQCNAALPDFESFRNHLKSHLEESGLSSLRGGMSQHWFGTCPYCRLSTPSVQELIKHITSHILTTVTEYSCQICQKLYRNSNELERHLIEVHSHHLYLCYACKEVFDTKYEIQRHFITKHFSEIKKFTCCICPTFPPINSEVEFDLHVRTVHCGFDSSLTIPSVYAKRESNLDRKSTMAVHTSLTNHSINLTLQKASPPNVENTISDYSQKNENKHNNNNNATEICSLCEFGDFKSEADLTAHRKLVHHTKDIHSKVSLQCAYCNENCKSRTELENHMKSHCQSSIGFGKHKCNICDEICHSAVTLAEHKLTHCKVIHGSKCSHCKVVITTEEMFLNHMINHNNCTSTKKCHLTLPVPCVICRQTLVSESETRLHARFHLQMDAIRCTICLQVYGRNDLKDSVCVKCLEGQKARQQCSTCNVSLKSVTELDTHMAEEPINIKKCQNCQLK